MKKATKAKITIWVIFALFMIVFVLPYLYKHYIHP